MSNNHPTRRVENSASWYRQPNRHLTYSAIAEASRTYPGLSLEFAERFLRDCLKQYQRTQYALNRWAALIYCCSNGRAEIDNLIAERALRGVAIGRRNYLFAGADSGGERAAAMYSLIGTARLNGLDPAAYLSYVLERIADHPTIRVNELLPWNVAPSMPSTAHIEPIR